MGTHHILSLKGTNSQIEMAFGPLSFDHEPHMGLPLISTRVGQKNVYTRQGRIVGEDHWGYLSGDRGRYVKSVCGDQIGYRPSPLKEAKLLDRVISSACMAPSAR